MQMVASHIAVFFCCGDATAGMRVWQVLACVLAIIAAATAAIGSPNSAYDKRSNVFSPQGRLIQAEFAAEAVVRGSTCIGIRCSDGVVLAIRKHISPESAALLPVRPVKRIYRTSKDTGLLAAGISSDGRALAHCAMQLYAEHKHAYGEPLCGRVLAQQLGSFLHKTSLKRNSRPLATAGIIACPTEDSRKLNDGDSSSSSIGELWVVDTSGAVVGYRTYCTGQNTADIHALWKQCSFNLDSVTCEQAMQQVVAALADKDSSILSSSMWEIAVVRAHTDAANSTAVVFEALSSTEATAWTTLKASTTNERGDDTAEAAAVS
jgi:20S proteasome alpha/beta subunit